VAGVEAEWISNLWAGEVSPEDLAPEELELIDTAELEIINETHLEPHHLIRRARLVHRTGRLTLAAGHGSYRVKAHMQRVGEVIGLDAVEAHVTLTEMTTTAIKRGMFRTEVSEVRQVGVNTDRLCDLERYISSINQETTEQEIDSELDRISAKSHLYPIWLNALAAGAACAAFAFLNGGGLIECFFVLLAAAVGQFLRRHMIVRGVNQFGVAMLAATVSCLIYLTLVTGLGLFMDGAGRLAAGYISAVLYLVPGFPLVTAALDLFRLDLSAGISRLVYALMVLGSAAMAVALVSTLAGVEPTIMEGYAFPVAVHWILLAVASFVGVFGFAIIFNSPWRMALAAAGIGMVSNLLRLLLLSEGTWSPHLAAAVAALLVGLLARLFSGPLRVPRLTISVPAVVIMVPGVMAYRAVFAANTGLATAAWGFALNAGLVVLGLAVGLGVARMLTDQKWTFEQLNH
jgi:uncharacterized membrane protein YjjP (DUF1212 family)